jgi:lipopolysaccharide export system protein LptA
MVVDMRQGFETPRESWRGRLARIPKICLNLRVLNGISFIRMLRFSLALAGFFFFCRGMTFAQVAPDSAQQVEQHVEIIHTDLFEFSRSDSAAIRRLIGAVHLRQDSTDFFCDSAHHYVDTNYVIAYSRVKVLMGDSMTLNANRMTYDGRTKVLNLYGNILLVQGKSTLRTEHLIWYRNESYGYYDTGGTLYDGENTLTSRQGYYYSERHYANFKKDVVLLNPKYTLLSDTLGYDTELEVAHFLAPTTVYDSLNTMYTEDGYYDTKNGMALLYNNTRAGDTSFTLFGDTIKYNRNLERGIAIGHVIGMQNDTGLVILGERGVFHSATEETIITGNPYAVQYMDDDTLFLFADTLFARREAPLSPLLSDTLIRPKSKDTLAVPLDSALIDSLRPQEATKPPSDSLGQRIFCAYHHVRIFMHQLQGRSDSLVYYESDSMIRFFDDPVMWSDSNQILGDTIEVFMRRKNIDSLSISRNGFMISREDTMGFNQVKGKKIRAKFRDKKIHLMWVNGNSETLYWAKNDKEHTYLGVNTAKCNELFMKFKPSDSKPERIVFREKPEGEFKPLSVVYGEPNQLEDFEWRITERPPRPDSVLALLPSLDSLLAIIKSMHPDSLRPREVLDSTALANADLPDSLQPKGAEGGSESDTKQGDLIKGGAPDPFKTVYYPWKDPTGKWMRRPEPLPAPAPSVKGPKTGVKGSETPTQPAPEHHPALAPQPAKVKGVKGGGNAAEGTKPAGGVKGVKGGN